MPHAETFNPKLVPRTVGEPEFEDAWDNFAGSGAAWTTTQ